MKALSLDYLILREIKMIKVFQLPDLMLKIMKDHVRLGNSEKLFVPEPGWKIKYTKILRKKTKWQIKSKKKFVYL